MLIVQVLCSLLKNPLEPERVQEIISEAVEIEKSFICDSLPVRLHPHTAAAGLAICCPMMTYVQVYLFICVV